MEEKNLALESATFTDELKQLLQDMTNKYDSYFSSDEQQVDVFDQYVSLSESTFWHLYHIHLPFY